MLHAILICSSSTQKGLISWQLVEMKAKTAREMAAAGQNQRHRKLLPEPTQVRFTGDWSSDSKLSSIQNGYWNDPFFEYFNTPAVIPKRTALIGRGYYVRFKLCDHYLKKTIGSFNSGSLLQVVSLGCGMDTAFFRSASEENISSSIHKWFELDFASVIQRKREIINEHEMLRRLAGNKLVLIEQDLRNLATLRDTLMNFGFDFTKPTLFYSECVVNYLKPSESEAILSWITSNVPNCMWLAYEQCYAHDFFGRIMVQHFQNNGCPILSIDKNSDVESQKLQLERTGFRQSVVLNVWDTFVKLAVDSEFAHVHESQQFDEYESFVVTCLHYSIRIGSNCSEVDALFESAPSVPSRLSTSKIPSPLLLTSDMDNTFSTHCSVLVNDKILILGGTNKNGTKLSSITQLHCTLDPDAKQFQTMESPCAINVPALSGIDSTTFQRVHSAAVFVKQLNSLYIFGGRKSPRTPCSAALIGVSLDCDNNRTSITSVSKLEPNSPEPGPKARWRHSLTAFNWKDGAICLFLFGGKTEKEIFSDAWIYICGQNQWTCSNIPSVARPSARHSHSACVDEARECIYVSGGMSSESVICEDSFWEFRYNENTWINHPEFSKLTRKVGCVALVHKNQLLVLGGYGNDSYVKLEHFLTRINLDTKEISHYELDLNLDIFLPFGFSAHITESKEPKREFLVIFGGGGNCFSFGTHYNNKCLLLKISSLELE